MEEEMMMGAPPMPGPEAGMGGGQFGDIIAGLDQRGLLALLKEVLQALKGAGGGPPGGMPPMEGPPGGGLEESLMGRGM